VTLRPDLEKVFAKVDAFFERVLARYPSDLACKAGCHDCCAPDLTVTPAEAEAIEAFLGALDPEARASVANRATASDGSRCAALDDAGRCSIYPVRPVVCRSHGVALRVPPKGRTSLPVVDACPKNFRGRDLSTIDADCVLDQRTLSMLLAAVHATRGVDPTARRDLTSLLRRGPPESAIENPTNTP
jgi:uncharacterized protein